MEAQRLGLIALAVDLNPVAVLINKAMIEIPPRFVGMPPVHPDIDKALTTWERAQGLAADVKAYGRRMREEAKERIGHLYPDATGWLDPHHKFTRRVRSHLEHTELARARMYPHDVACHRGPPGSLSPPLPIPAGHGPPLRDPQSSDSPQIRGGSTVLPGVGRRGAVRGVAPPRHQRASSVSGRNQTR